MSEVRLPLGKNCTRCKEWKLFEDFHRRHNVRDGRDSHCKACQKQRLREYQRNNLGKVIESRRRYYEENREKALKYAHRYRQKNAEKVQQYNRQWYKENPDKARELTRRWRKENPEKILEHNRLRRARKSSARGEFTYQEWLELCEAYGDVCLCCKGSGPLQADHVLPLSKGGSNYIENIQPLCATCNCRKGAKTIDYR